MSYKCDKCNEVHNGSQLKHVSKVRNVRYNVFVEKKAYKGDPKQHFVMDTQGQEIVKEDQLCEKCYALVKDTDPIVIESNKTKEVDYINRNPKKPVDNRQENDYSMYEKMGDDYEVNAD